MVSKVFEKSLINSFVDDIEKFGLYLIYIMFLGHLEQLQIFKQLYFIALQVFLTGLGLLEL